MKLHKLFPVLLFALFLFIGAAHAGPYAPAAGESGSTAIHMDDTAFVAWATGWQDYEVGSDADATWQTPEKALGKAEGSSYDIVSLGRGGVITLTFAKPIVNGAGADFAVFENSFSDTALELAYVEVSADGHSWRCFPNSSLTAAPVGGYGTVDPTNIYQLGCKYQQGYGEPYDLDAVGLDEISYVRILDIVGDGNYRDSAGNVIYDPYPTSGSAGFDLDAIGVIHQKTVVVAAVFTVTPASGTAPLTVRFSDASTGGVDNWNWSFGDGATSSEQNPEHTYLEPGTYSVTLYVDGPYGSDQLTKSGCLTVSSDTPTNHPPRQPELSQPAGGAADLTLPVTLQGRDFSDPDSGDQHSQTRWQVSRSSGFDTLVFDQQSESNLTAIELDDAILENGTTYYWRVQYFDQAGAASEWSESRSFSTLAQFQSRNYYFPHIACDGVWESEIALINAAAEQSLTGDLIAFDNSGGELERKSLTLAAHARRKLNVGDEFSRADRISYLVFQTSANKVKGYTKFYVDGVYRVAVPVVAHINRGDLYVPHIASSDAWWTGLSLVNTTSSSKVLTIHFNGGDSKEVELAAGEHKAVAIGELFAGEPQPEITSAEISNCDGIVGLVIFGSKGTNITNLGGVILKDERADAIYYPHIAADSTWWTGLVTYNPGPETCMLNITPYQADGEALTVPAAILLAGYGRYIGVVSKLNLPPATAWLQISASNPVVGLEMFGTLNGQQMAGYTGVGIAGTQKVFANLEKEGWTGIAFVNLENGSAEISMTAYAEDGAAVATTSIDLAAHAKVVDSAENLFSGQDLSRAGYIQFSSSREVVGFQLNGSADMMMLDALPGM